MMLAARGAIRASGAGLPYDAEVEYLESSGTQYIELSFNSTTDGFCDFDITYQMTALNSSPPFGYRYGGSARYGIWNGAAGEYYVGADASHSVLIAQNENVNTLSLRNGQYVDYNGAQTAVGTGTVRSNIGAILFGSVSSSSGATSRSLTSAKIQAFKLYNVSGVLLFDGIPVRKGTVGYLYDRVSGKLFGNAGTGDFVLGPDVVPVEWLQSDATSYINTGIIPDDTYGMEVTGYTTQTVDSAWIGTRNNSNQRCFMGYSPALGFYYGWNGRQDIQYTTGVWSTASMNLYNSRKNMMDGTEVGSIAETLEAQNRAIYLFALTANGTLGLKLKSALITKGSDDVQKLVSIRVGSGSTWEGAMMDTLTRRIYRNAGTGAFTYGNDLKYPIPA